MRTSRGSFDVRTQLDEREWRDRRRQATCRLRRQQAAVTGGNIAAMSRIAFVSLAVLVAAAAASPGCDDGKAKVKAAAKKVDKAIDDFDLDDAKQHLIKAKDSI